MTRFTRIAAFTNRVHQWGLSDLGQCALRIDRLRYYLGCCRCNETRGQANGEDHEKFADAIRQDHDPSESWNLVCDKPALSCRDVSKLQTTEQAR